MKKKLIVETWGELGSIPGIAEIMPRETEVANAMKKEGVIESLYVKDGAKGAFIVCNETDKDRMEAQLKQLPMYPYFTKIEYTLVNSFWD